MNWKNLEKGVIAVLVTGMVGCSSLPGSDAQQGAVIGGASGAAVGAAVSKENRALGAVIGGAVGAAGGYVIGKNADKMTGNDSDEETASRKAEEAPVTATQAKTSPSADVNSDGFVTLDEVVALKDANLTDDQIIERLRATKQVFELTTEQRRYLADKGVSQNVIDRLITLNRESNANLPSDAVITKKPPTEI